MARILVISHAPTHPADSGNRARVNSLLMALQSAGHEICLFLLDEGNNDRQAMARTWDRFWNSPYRFPAPGVRRQFRERLSTALKRDLCLPYGVDDWYKEPLNRRLQELEREFHFEVVLVEYVFFSKALDCFPNALKIIDTHDVFGDRHKLFLEHDQRPAWFYTTPDEEGTGVNRADAILAIQEKEKNYFSSLAPNKEVLTVGHLTRIVPPSPSRPFHNRLLFIGSDNDVNRHALSWFLEAVWPTILGRSPHAQLEVVGTVGLRFRAWPEGCRSTGTVADLATCYARGDLVVNPVRFGTGLKIKNIEALGYGMPLVTTDVGAEGIEEGAGTAFLTANTAEEFTESVCRLLEQRETREKLSNAALEFVRNYNDRATRPLFEFIENGLAGKSRRV